MKALLAAAAPLAISLAGLVAPVASLPAQIPPRPSGALAGIVRDTAAQPLALVLVTFPADSSRRALTDSTGAWRLEGLPAGIHRILFRRLGFVAAEFQLAVLEGQERRAVVELVPAPLQLDTVTVASTTSIHIALERTGYYDRLRQRQEGAGVGRFMTPEDIDRLRALTRTTHILESGGVRLLQSERGMSLWPVGAANIVLRGYPLLVGPCQMAVFIDGIEVDIGKYYGEMTYGTGGLDAYIQPNEIRAIEIYQSASGTPQQFQSVRNAQCGSIVIWTKSG